jgi:Domain of unknown function (DUF5753)
VWCDHSFNIFGDREDAPRPIRSRRDADHPGELTDPADVTTYQEVFTRLQDAAVTGEDAQRLITEASHSL